MKKEILINKLEKYDYNYIVEIDYIKVNLDYGLKMYLHFDNTDKLVIKDKLENWNLLFGVMNTSFKKAILFCFIGLIVLGWLVHYGILIQDLNLSAFLIMYCSLICFSIPYYAIKIESFKMQVINWLENAR